MTFYLDEDVNPKVAELLRRQRCPARSTQEAGNRGAADEQQLEYAAQTGSALVTRNRDDFIALTVQFFGENRPHRGLVIVPRSIPADDPALLAKLLLNLAKDRPEGLPPYSIVFLRTSRSH